MTQNKWVTTMASETPGSTKSLLGQGSFLTKPSLLMVGCTGKKSSTFTALPNGLCPLCETKGKSHALKTYRINFTQSIFLCSDPQCIYPLGYTPVDNIITNTADLKNYSPSKQKKRNISELSPPFQPNVKRSKSDLPALAHYSPINAATSAPAESSTSVRVVELDATLSGISQCGWIQNRDLTEQNVPETSGSFSSPMSVMQSQPSSPLASPGSHDTSPDSSKLVSAVTDRLNESEDVKSTDNLYSINAGNNISNKLSEMKGSEESEDKELGNPEPYLLPENPELNRISENGITLNGSPGIPENYDLSSDSESFSKLKVSPTAPQNVLQMKNKSPQEVSSTVEGEERTVPISEGSRDMEPAQHIDFTQDTAQDPCKSGEPSQFMDTVARVDRGCAEGNALGDLSTSLDLNNKRSASFQSIVFPVSEQSEQILNSTSLKSVSPKHVESPVKTNIDENPVGELEPEDIKTLYTASTSYSPDNIQPTCSSGNDSVDVCKRPCTTASSLNDSEELTASPLDVCHLSPFLQLVEDIQPELAIDSLNLSGVSCATDDVVNYSNVGSQKEAPLLNGHFSDQDDIVGDSLQSNSEATTQSAVEQDILPETQSKENPLSDILLTPGTSIAVSTDKNDSSFASEEILWDDQKLDNMDLIQSCQKSVCDRIAHSNTVLANKPGEENCSLMEICNTVCPVPEKEHGSTELAMTYLSDNSISTKKLTEELVEPCEASTPPRKLQALFTNKDNSILDATGPSCHITSAMNECDNVDIAAPLPDSQLENSISTPTPCSQAGIVVDKKTSPLHETASAVKEISNEYTSATLPSDSEELKGTIKKLSFENTVLPDLLLDIQLEHRMEEQLSEAPSPASDTDLMDTDSADCKQSKEDNLLKTSLDKPCVQKNKIDSMEITDPEVINDKLQNISLSDTLSLEGAINNESIESAPLDISLNTEQSYRDKIREVRTYENSQRILQWKNRKSLCWLDCILSALVQSRTIAMMVAKQAPNKESIILHLFAKYDEAFELFTGSSKKKSGRPTKSEGCLHDVRMDIFKKLKPLLKCELGHNESPVFAFPLLLKLDPDFEKLFIHSFSWNFKCESCGYTYQDRCHKTITTFTKIVKDWHPLNAAHRSPCNKCSAVDQRREMRLETLQCMFMLHFVEGLPSSDLKTYAFPFGDHWYEIRTVIRYRDQHFSTWMANDDDTWLESDDLKGSFCRRHHKLRVRAEDLHVVIWERSNRKNIQDSSNLGSISENQTSIPTAEIKTCNNFSESLLGSPEAEPSEPASTKCLPQVELVSESIVSDPSTEHPPDHLVQTPVSVVPLSVIDKSSPLAGMEGYADDDVITLTLVEIPLDSEGYPVNSDPPNLGVIQVEESSDSVLQPALVEIHSDSKEPSQHTKPKKSMHSPSESPMSDTAAAPVCTIEQSPNQPGLQSKQTANMTATAIATSTPSYKSFGKKSVVDNLMCSLVKKDNSFLNSSLSKKTPQSKLWQSANLLKESDFNGATKKAENFDGFQAKSVSNNDKSSLLLSKFLNNSSSFKVPEEKTAPSVKSCLTQPALGHLKPGKNGLSFGKLLAKDGGSSEDKVQKLRMKLLKKLKAKKKELAIIEKISHSQQNGSHAGESNGVLPSGVNRRAHLQGFLQELQDHIDNVDNESIGTASSCTSICSSPGDAEFFAELFSPSPADNPGNDSRFLEMLADGFRISSDHSQQTAGLDHSMNNTTTQSTSGADAFPNASSHSSSGEESLNLLSSSTMAMLNDDADYLDSFVDIF